jgi:hypothetical protein
MFRHPNCVDAQFRSLKEKSMTFQRLIRLSSLLFLLFGLSVAADAQGGRRDDGRWEQLGRSYVDGRRDHDRIAVNNASTFRALQLEVRGGTIEFQRVVVHFDNGADHELSIRERIPDGGKTRVIDLPGDRRRVGSVEFWYSQERWRSRPSVNLLGLRGTYPDGPGRSDDDRRRDDERRRDDDSRWEVLGQSYVNGRADHDRIFVNNRGTFRQLQLGIRGGTIEFERVVVHFYNGEDQEIQVRDRIPDKGKTRVIDLPGDRRRIRSVEFWYSKEGWRSRPHVNLWGRR